MGVLLMGGHTLLREGVAELLRRRNIDAAAAGDGRAGVRRAEACNPDVILLDLRMPDIDGLEVLDHLMRRRVAAHQVVEHLQAVDIGHAQIQENHIRVERLRPPHPGAPVPGGRGVDVAAFQKPRQAFAKQGVIVYEEYAHRRP